MSDHKQFFAALKQLAEPAAIVEVSRFFWVDPNADSGDTKVLGIRFGKIFQLPKQFTDLPLTDGELGLGRVVPLCFFVAPHGSTIGPL